MARGASSRSGPAPDPQALRRDDPGDRAGWTTLPGPREGDPPAWPFDDPSPRELEFWARQWRRPQAWMWERNDQAEEVALYVRALLEAAEPRASTAVRTLVKQLQESLGISLPGLLRNRWRIGGAQAESEPQPRSASSSRGRFRVVA